MGTMVNPYIAGAPVTEARMFFGREDVFQWIENSIAGQYADHILVIHGQRRVGKTSVLKQLGNRLPRRFIPVFFDLQGRTHTTLDRFLWWLAREIVRVLKQDREIEIPLPQKESFAADLEYFEHRFLPDIQPALGSDTLLLTFDEFDNLEQSEIKEELARPLIDYLRRLMGNTGLNFIFSIGSSGRKLENMQAAYTEFFKTALYKKISFLNEDQTRSLITRPVEGILEYDKQAVTRIYQIAGGHPYFTQLTCHELFAKCQRTDQRIIKVSDINSVLEDVIERGTVNLKFVWDEASDIEKWSLAALAELEKTDNLSLTDFLRKHRVRFSESDLTSGLLHLREKDVLTSENRFVIHLLRLWLQKNRPIEQAREELTEVNPIANRYIEIGLEFKDSQQYDRAIESFQEALKIAKDNLQAQVSLALVYMDQKMYDKAVVEFEKGLAMDDENVSARSGLCEAHLALGDAAISRGRTKEATLSYQRVLAINAEHTDARQRLAELSRQRAEKALMDGKEKEALSIFAEALAYTPEDPALIERVNTVQAEKKARELAALLARSEKEARARNWEGVVKSLEEALSLAPEDTSIQKRISEVKSAQEKEQLDTLLAKADAAAGSGRWDEAIQALTSILSAKPDQAVETRLAEVRTKQREARLSELKRQARELARLELFDEALSTWEEYLALEPAAREKVRAEIEEAKKAQGLAKSYTEAQRAYTRKNYNEAVNLLKGIINQDENYKDASRLLAQSIERRRTTSKWWQSKWVLGVAVISIVVAAAWFGSPLMSPLFAPTAAPTQITAAATPSAVPIGTPDLRILNATNQHKYQYVKTEKNWHQARDYCASQGGHLVTIQDAAEDEYIYQLTSGLTWLGATDEVTEGTWAWVSGEPWEYTNWDDGEPNNSNGSENYLTYHAGGTPSRWNNIGGDAIPFFTCEWEPDSETPIQSSADQIRSFADPILAEIANKTPDYQDDFSDLSSGWPTNLNSSGNEYGYQDGGYLISNWRAKMPGEGSCNGIDPPTSRVFSDFVLEADGQFINQGEGAWAVLFRTNDTASYGANISPAGMFYFHKNVNDIHTPLPQTESKISSFRSGSSANHLTLIAQGNQMAVYVNGEPVGMLTDSSSSQGTINLTVCNGNPLQVLIDNLKVWDISGISVETSSEQIRSFADPLLTAIANKAPDYQDNFSDPQSGWPNESTSNGDRWGYADGAYSVTLTRSYRNPSGDHCVDINPSTKPGFPDFVLEVEAKFVTDTWGSLHFIFRGMPPTLQRSIDIVYFMGLFPNGTFFLNKNIGANQINIVEDPAVPPLQAGKENNRLMMIAQGSSMAVYINGEPFVLVQDATWQYGTTVLNFGACNESDTDTALQVQFDDLKLWNITDLSP